MIDTRTIRDLAKAGDLKAGNELLCQAISEASLIPVNTIKQSLVDVKLNNNPPALDITLSAGVITTVWRLTIRNNKLVAAYLQ